MNYIKQIKDLQAALGISHGELIRLAREAAHDGTVLHLGGLRNHELLILLGMLYAIRTAECGVLLG